MSPENKKLTEPTSALEAMEAELDLQKRYDDMPYDGLVGSPPAWIPGPLRQEFSATRRALFDEADKAELRRWMRGRRKQFEPGYAPLVVPPRHLEDKIDALNYIKALVDMGKDAAIDAYLGKSAKQLVRGIILQQRQSSAGRKKKGYRGPLHRGIERLCRDLEHPDLVSLLQILENVELIEDQYESLSEPIDVHEFNLVEVVWAEHSDERDEVVRKPVDGSVTYRERGNLKAKTIALASLNNILSQIRKG